MNKDAFDFWFNGVFSCFIAIIGLLMNIASIFIIYKNNRAMSNMFNSMLIVLFSIDSMVLFTSILGVMVWDLRLEHISLLIIVYPYFTYPVYSIALTTSIFTTVSISHDRYLATKYPIHHRQQLSELCDQKRHMLKYFIPIILISVLINIPTFLEYDIVYAPPAIHQYLQTNHSEDTLINQKYVDEISDIWKIENSIRNENC